jgi:hypothetical protein
MNIQEAGEPARVNQRNHFLQVESAVTDSLAIGDSADGSDAGPAVQAGPSPIGSNAAVK